MDEKKKDLKAVPPARSIADVSEIELKAAIYDQSKQAQMIQNAINVLENELTRREQLKRQRPAIAAPVKDKLAETTPPPNPEPVPGDDVLEKSL